MSYHSSCDFEFGKPISNEIINDVVYGLKENREYNKEREGSDSYTCGAYWIGSTIDACISNIGGLLDSYIDKIIPEKDYLKWLSDSPEGVDELVRRVLDKIGWIIKND